MAIEKKRMQQRYGTYQQFQDNINNLLPNEFASVVSGDPNTAGGEGLYFQCGSNTPKRILTEEDKSLPVVTTIDINSDNDHIPTEKAVYDYVAEVKATVTQALNGYYRVNTTDQQPNYESCDAKTIYVGAKLGNEQGIIIPFFGKDKQMFIGAYGTICVRHYTGGNDYQDWEPNLSELTANKKSSITSNNQASMDFFPSIKAVVDYLTANYIGNGSGTVTENNLATALKNSLYRVDNTTENVIYSADNPRIIYTNARVNGNKPTLVFTLFDNSQLAMYKDGHLYCRTYANSAYGDWIDLKAMSIGESNKTSDAYSTVRAVYNFVTAFVASAISGKANTSDVNTALNTKEDLSNKVPNRTAMDNLNSETQYPSVKTMVQYTDEKAFQVLGEVSDLQAYLGYTSSDILGLQVDFVNSRFTRLAGAEELEAGSDFDDFPMFGGRRRCCVANDGTINAYYGEQGYAEDGTNGQVMVYQPKFYYRMVPLKLEKQASGLGYHIRKANYYVTANPHPGFKLHPLFYDANGNEIDYVLLSAYEGSMYDVSASAYVNDSVDSITYGSGDLLCSVGKGANDSGKKPISGKLTGIGTKENFETMANNRGTGWHLDTIQSVAANQLLMLIELGQPELQSVIGNGCVSGAGTGNASSLTGSTSALGNETGMATKTIAESAGETTECTENGKLSVSYRGLENPWGNIWKHINGINLWGDGTMNGGQAYVCHDFSFNEQKKSENYEPVGFTVSNASGYISAFGYGAESYDWLFLPSETSGSSAVPVGDRFDGVALNGYKELRLGGKWNDGAYCGAFCLAGNTNANLRHDVIGCRMLYVPTATV